MTPISAEQLNDSLARDDWPVFEDVCIEAQEDALDAKQSINCRLTITPELSYLVGHFPDQPIVPGVVQVHWAGELSKQVFACEGFSALKKVKFINPILPNTTLRLSLSHKQKSQQVNFVYSDDQQTYSSGLIAFQ